MTLAFGVDHSKSNRVVPGSCLTIPLNFIKISLVVFWVILDQEWIKVQKVISYRLGRHRVMR